MARRLEIQLLVDQGIALAANKALGKEVTEIRTRLCIPQTLEALASRLDEAREWGTWPSPIDDAEGADYELFADWQTEITQQTLADDPGVQGAVDRLLAANPYPARDFFLRWLLRGYGPSSAEIREMLHPQRPSVAPAGDGEITVRSSRPTESKAIGALVEIEHWSAAEPELSSQGWQKGIHPAKIDALKVVIRPWTTKQQLAAAWPRIAAWQKQISGKRRPGRRRAVNVETVRAFAAILADPKVTWERAIEIYDQTRPEPFAGTPQGVQGMMRRAVREGLIDPLPQRSRGRRTNR